jgi:LuxR family maltose regulon positive regulatory protein
MEVLLVQALLHEAQGDEQAALNALADALALAKPEGFLRPFIDGGPHMASLSL